jgi:hypothetical protein
MTTLNHAFTPEEIMGWLDRDLSASDQQSVQDHIAECAECAQLADQFRRLSQQFQSWTVEMAPQGVGEAVQSQFAATFSAASINTPKNAAAKRGSWRLALIVPCCIAAVILVVMFTLRMGQPMMMKVMPEPQQQATASAGRRAFGSLAASTSVHELDQTDSEVSRADKNIEMVQKTPSPASRHSLVRTEPLRLIPPPVIAPMIARTVSLSIIVKNFTMSRTALDALLARHHGYPAQLTVMTPENSAREFQASLRVPATELAAALADVKSLGRVENETQSGEEVTQQHADLVARLKNSRETEQRFQAILQQHTGKIEDILAVEQEIARVRGTIESMEAEQQNLEHRVDFATVNLQLSEEFQAHLTAWTSPSIPTRLHNALVAGYRQARDMVLDILLFAAEAGPTLLIVLTIFGVPAFFLVRRYRRIRTRLG